MKAKTSTTLRKLVIASILYVVLALIATGIAIAENRKAEFGPTTSLPVMQDFLYGSGTAMSPPLYWLIAQVVLTILAPRRDRWGTIGVVGLALFGLLFIIGTLGEPINLEIFNPLTFDLLKAVIQATTIIVLLAMMIFGILEWRERRRVK